MTNNAAHQKLRQLTIRLTKEASSFLYFQLESNEGLAFYSTLESSVGQEFRDLQITHTIEFQEEVNNLLTHFQKQYPLEILEEKEITNSL